MYTQGKKQIPSDHKDTDAALPHETAEGMRAGLVDLKASNQVLISKMLERNISEKATN